jgi:hypothetical protein
VATRALVKWSRSQYWQEHQPVRFRLFLRFLLKIIIIDTTVNLTPFYPVCQPI